jgi:uncharacterized lipoprotein YmbA
MKALLWVFVAVGLAGCAAAPPTVYYRMAAQPGPVHDSAPLSIVVRGIGLPGYLDQTGIAKPAGAYEFASYANALWAEPLGDMLQSVMVQDLAQALPEATVTASGGAVGAAPGVLVEINILRFDPDPYGRMRLLAQVAVKTGPERTLCGAKTLQSSAAPDAGVTGIVAAMSGLWAGAAGQVADMVEDCPTAP